MKRIGTFTAILIAALLLCGMLASCSGNDKNASDDIGYKTDAARYDSEAVTEDAGVGEKNGVEGSESETTVRQAGMITAAAWDDNKNYSAWQALFTKGQEEDKDGKFVEFASSDKNWGLDTTARVTVTVTSGEKAVAGATVTYRTGNQQTLTAKTDACGVAYLFTKDESGTVKVKSGENEQEGTFSAENRTVNVELAGAETKKDVIKLMFVLDVTGSMGDELTFLQTELADVIRRVATSTNTQIDLGFVFYRDDVDDDDDDDDEKMVLVDFKNVNAEKDLKAQIAILSKQKAAGGGDWPEAVDEALETAIAASWGNDNATRILFHVLDAPPHDEKAHQTRFATAIKAAAAKGIRICPILCSGADDLCEYLVRQEAIYTAGTFIYVTDDSGIGLSHHDPDLPNAVVEKLNDMLVRLISGYHTGTFEKPVYWKGEQKQTETTEETPAEETAESGGEA